jgi:hypothetical protein
MDVMQAVADTNFERQIASHLRDSYSESIVRLPDDGSEFKVSELAEDVLERWVRAGIGKARGYELRIQSSIASFVALMFDVAPNFDDHRLCEVLLGDQERTPDERMEDVLSVLSEKNWEAIRNDYEPQAWVAAEEKAKEAFLKKREAPEDTKAMAAAGDSAVSGKTLSGKTMSGKTLSGKTLRGKTLSGKTMSRTIAPKSQTIKVQPEVPERDAEFDQNTVKIDRKE